MLLTENRCCSCCYVSCVSLYDNYYQPFQLNVFKSCQILIKPLAKFIIFILQMTLIFSQIFISARATSDANQLMARNQSFFDQESSNFLPQVPANHRMHPDQAVQRNNQYEEEERRDLMRTYFDNYKAFENQPETQNSMNHILIGQSSFVLPSTYEKSLQSKKRQVGNNFILQVNDQPVEDKSNQQVSKWSIAFNDEPQNSVVNSARIISPVATTTSSYFNTLQRYVNDTSSSPILSSEVHFDDEYDHQGSQSQSLATVATPRSGSQDSENQQLKQAQRALEQSLALQDRLVKLLNRAKSSSSPSPSPIVDQSTVGSSPGQQISNNESYAISSLKPTTDSKQTASPINVDNLISLKQSDEMMRGIVPMSRFVQRPKNRLSGSGYSKVNYNTNQLLPVDGANLQQSIDIVEPKAKLKFNHNVSNLNTRFSASDNSDVPASTTTVAGNLNGEVSQFSSLADVMTMKQPAAVTRVSSREEQPLLVVAGPTAAINNNNNNGRDDDDLGSSDRFYGNQDKFQVDSTTTTPTNWIATHNQLNPNRANNNNKNHVMNRETSLAGSLAQPSSNLNDLVKLEKFYNPKLGGMQTLQTGKKTTTTTTTTNHNNNQDLFDFIDLSRPSKADQLIDLDHNEFDQIFSNANNEQVKQFKKSNHRYSTTAGLGAATNIDQNNYNYPKLDLNNNNINGESDFNPVQQRFEKQKQQQLAYDDWPTLTSSGSVGATTREADLVEQPVSSYSNIGYNNKLGSNNQAYDNINNDNTNNLGNNDHFHHHKQQPNYRDGDIIVDEDYPSTSSHQQQQPQPQPRKRNKLKKPHSRPKHSISAQNKAFYDRRKRLFYETQSPTTPNHLLGGVSSLTYQPSVAQGSYTLSSSDGGGANYNTDGSPSYQVVHVHSKAEKKSHGKYLWPIVGGGLTMLMGFLIISNILLSIPLLAIGASSLFNNQGGQHSQQLVPVYNLSQLITTQRPPSGRRRRRKRRSTSEGVGIDFGPKPTRFKHRRRRDIANTTRGRVNKASKNDLELRIERFIDGIVKSSSDGASKLLSGFRFGFGWNRRQLLRAAYCHRPNRIRQQYGG